MDPLELDLRFDEVQPVQRFLATILQQAIYDRVERIEISLDDVSSETGLRFRLSAGGKVDEPAPAPGHLFAPIIVVLCNLAGINYYAKGKVEGNIVTRRPESTWALNSEDMNRTVVLLRTSPIPERREFRPIDWGR